MVLWKANHMDHVHVFPVQYLDNVIIFALDLEFFLDKHDVHTFPKSPDYHLRALLREPPQITPGFEITNVRKCHLEHPIGSLRRKHFRLSPNSCNVGRSIAPRKICPNDSHIGRKTM